MATDIECKCVNCSKKERHLRIISRNTAAKHIKRYGLHASALPRRRSSSMRRRQSLTRAASLRRRISRRISLNGGDDDQIDFDPPELQGHRPIEQEFTSLRLPPPHQYSPDVFELNDVDNTHLLPPAFALPEQPCVRIAYLQAVQNNLFAKMSVVQVNTNLNMTLNALDSAGVLPDVPPPVRTLVSAKKHLGIEPDDWIIPYAACSKCWKLHTPYEMLQLPTSSCTVLNCDGHIYEEYLDGKGRTKRRAVRTIPQTSLIQSLRRMVRRKGFRKLVRDSRDAPQNEQDDQDFKMTGMHHGSLWHDMETGIKREVGDLDTIRDVPIEEGSAKKLSSHRFGLHLIGNQDW